MLFSSAIELLLPVSTYFVVLLCGLSAWSFRRSQTGLAPSRWRWAWLALSAWAWLLSTPALANLWLRQMEGPPAPPAAPASALAAPPAGEGGLVVVLASGDVSLRGGRPKARLDAAGWERVTAGVALWRRTGGQILLTGGQSGAGAPTESLADLMARQARDMGVPPEAILISDGSSRTFEDLEVAALPIRAHTGPVWLVTSALHMLRSLAVARHLGLQVRAHPCDYRQLERPNWTAWLPNSGGAALFAAVMHEAFGLAYYRWRGWA